MCECVLLHKVEELMMRLEDFGNRLDKIEAELKDGMDKAIDDFMSRADISDPLAPAKPKVIPNPDADSSGPFIPYGLPDPTAVHPCNKFSVRNPDGVIDKCFDGSFPPPERVGP